jgi:hypothetical protein
MRVYSGGLSQRHFVPGEETCTDEATAVVTSKRVVFRGQTKAIEWGLRQACWRGRRSLEQPSRAAGIESAESSFLQVADVEILGAALEAAIDGRPGLQEQANSTPVLPPPPGS